MEMSSVCLRELVIHKMRTKEKILEMRKKMFLKKKLKSREKA